MATKTKKKEEVISNGVKPEHVGLTEKELETISENIEMQQKNHEASALKLAGAFELCQQLIKRVQNDD